MRFWPILIVLLAGCTDAPTAPMEDEVAGEDPLAAPAPWAIGDWFRYDLPGFDRDITWVVTGEEGDDWVVDLDDAGFRWFHDAFSQISTVGPISKDHLAGSQEAGPVRFFDFPLSKNKTWDLTWDDDLWRATVVDVADGKAEIQATHVDGRWRDYVYDADIGWFRSIAAYGADGTTQFETRLMRSGSDYAGQYYRWSLYEGYEKTVVPGGVVVETFDVHADAQELWLDIDVVCDPGGVEGDQGTWSFTTAPEDPQAEGFDETGLCPAPFSFTGTLGATAGEWGVTAHSTGGTVDVQIIPRTLNALAL